MVLLANRLRKIAGSHSFGGEPMWLKAGISHGPIAGGVIGSHRAFYCLYGDGVNTAARMCKYAAPGKPHCTAGFAEALSGKTACILTVPRAMQEIKGLGMMETYDVQVVCQEPTRGLGLV